MIVLDPRVLIAYLDGDDSQHASAEELLAREIDDDFAANPLTLAEVLVAPARDGRLEETKAALADLDIQELDFPVDTATKLARLRVSTGLKMPDCCVLLAAEDADARLASFYDRLVRAATSRQLRVVEH